MNPQSRRWARYVARHMHNKLCWDTSREETRSKTREDLKGNCSTKFRLDSHDSGQDSMTGVVNREMNFRFRKTRECLDQVSTESTGSQSTMVLIAYGSLYSFSHQWLYSPLLGPGLFFSFVIYFTQTVGLLGRVISPSQGCYLHTGQHKQNKRTHRQPCIEWDSNPRSQRLSERRQFMP
jgi:hypothetical protein